MPVVATSGFTFLFLLEFLTFTNLCSCSEGTCTRNSTLNSEVLTLNFLI